jgi:hypothetical protein
MAVGGGGDSLLWIGEILDGMWQFELQCLALGA